ncbi:O-antigen ligase family protein [Rhodopirellula baltica]|uniref:Cap5J protein-putative transmembrane protein n=1 Tax=Rhodopirellula baltica SWK14 TaxID=993516 RepID=L7CC19_RHOBT|nr:O-antigen ligase family protein [Rhodopirellula baltica]ELP31385.1 Cap5J protein-putative transmembrane protein [Rhodopirellula baltica SWK14]
MLHLAQQFRTAWKESSLLAATTWCLVALSTFFGPLDISSDAETMTVGLDGQVACKLLIAGMAFVVGAYGVLTSASVRQTMTTLPPVMLLTILFLVLLATPIAISGASLAVAMINVAYVAFIIVALFTLGLRGMVTAILVGVTATMTLALFFYVFVPKYGLFPELLADGLVVNRMSGTAHPNAVGRAMVLGGLATLYLVRKGTLQLNVAIPLAACFALSAYLAWSRTALVAGAFGMCILFLDRLTSRLGVSAIALVALLGVVGVTSIYVTGQEDHFVGKILAKVSKSGDAEEITSGTGRSEIWAKGISLIANRPIIGHGFNAAPILMLEFSQATHNAVLHATLAGGVIAGALMACLLLWNVFLIFGCEHLLLRALSAFTVLSCMTEDTVLETFPGPCTIVWLMCIFYPVLVDATQIDMIEAERSQRDQEEAAEPGTGFFGRPGISGTT